MAGGYFGTRVSDGLKAPWVIDGAINRKLFETYVETQLAPTLNKGDVMILDNLSSHKSAVAAKLLKSLGAWFLFLPPYSLDPERIRSAHRDGLLQAQALEPKSRRANI